MSLIDDDPVRRERLANQQWRSRSRAAHPGVLQPAEDEAAVVHSSVAEDLEASEDPTETLRRLIEGSDSEEEAFTEELIEVWGFCAWFCSGFIVR